MRKVIFIALISFISLGTITSCKQAADKAKEASEEASKTLEEAGEDLQKAAGRCFRSLKKSWGRNRPGFR